MLARWHAEPVELQPETPSLLELVGGGHQYGLLEEPQQELYIQRAISAHGDINVVDNLYCGTLTNPDGDVYVSGDLCASPALQLRPLSAAGRTPPSRCRCNDGHVIADRIQGNYCRVETVVVDALITGPNTLAVNSLAVSGTLTAPTNTSCDEVELSGTRQFASAFLQTFDDATEAERWHGGRAMACDGDGVLGGGCSSGPEATRVVQRLPPHTRLQLEASFLFVDAWQGEHAYAKVDGQHVWLDHYDSTAGSGGIDVCGGPTPERRLRIPVAATVPHSASSVNITFGSTLPAATDGASCDASWAVDNVELSIR